MFVRVSTSYVIRLIHHEPNGKCNIIMNVFLDVYGRLRGLVYTPVCGSNGVTYSHPYFLNLDACITKTYIQEVSKGPCG